MIVKTLKLVHLLNKKYMPLLIICKLLASTEIFVNILLGSRILDLIVTKQPISDTMRLVLIMVTSTCLIILARWGLENILRVMEQTLVSCMRQSIANHCLTLDYEVLEKKETLEMIQKAEDGMNAGGGLVAFLNDLASTVECLVTTVYSAIVLTGLFFPVAKTVSGLAGFLNRWYSALLLIAVLLLSVALRYVLARYLNRIQHKSFERNVEFNRGFSYFFSLIYQYRQGKDIRLYRMQDKIIHEMNKNGKQIEQNGQWMKKRRFPYLVGRSASNYLLCSSAYAYVGLKVMCGLISVGSTMKYVTTITKLSESLGHMIENYSSLSLKGEYLANYYDFLSLKNKKYDGTLPVEKRDDNEYLLEFRDVSFHYPNQEQMVLSHVSVKFTIGEKMAIAGPNGAGKSTFIKLLCRLYDPTEGEILLNGIDIRLYDYEEYMRIFSVVFQDYQLFSFSLAQNVAASLTYDRERVTQCLNKAGFEKQLSKFPDGIDTNLYQMQEKGVEVSGGESQKIALARALYKSASVVILDEPTSALDPVSEFEIYRHFDEMVEGRTSVYISHRMSSCRFCSRILVFDGGRIVQDGNHETLLHETDGLYAKLWEAQAVYYN